MNEDLVSQVIEFIRTTGETLVTETFRITVKAVYADAIGEFISVLVLVALGILFIKLGNKVWKECDLGSSGAKKDDSNSGLYFIWFILKYIAPLFSFLVAVDNSADAIKYLLAPEWYAVIKLIGLVQ